MASALVTTAARNTSQWRNALRAMVRPATKGGDWRVADSDRVEQRDTTPTDTDRSVSGATARFARTWPESGRPTGQCRDRTMLHLGMPYLPYTLGNTSLYPSTDRGQPGRPVTGDYPRAKVC